MFIDQLRRLSHDFDQDSEREPPPHWAVLVVRWCVIGLLVLPVVFSLAMAGHLADGAMQPVLFWGVAGLWAAAFVVALALCCRASPPDKR